MMHRSALLPLTLAAGLFAAACGPSSGASNASGGAAPTSGAASSGSSTPASKTSGSDGAAVGQPVKGGTFTVAMARDATTFDTTRQSDVYSAAVLALTVDTLYEVDKDGKVVGRLVEKTENPQPNVYAWTLRKGIKFQDGTDFNSDAVKFNLERHINDPKSVRNQDVKDITSIETPDPQTVRVTLKAPYAPFPSKLTDGAGYMLSPTAVQKLGDNLQRDLTGAGSGAFKFSQWQKDTQVVLDRNPDYWKKAPDGSQLPYLDKVIYKPFPDENVRLTNLKTGDADALLANPPYKDYEELKTAPELTVKEIPGVGFQFIDVNTSKPPFDDPAVRRAFSYAIDRSQIRQTVLFGAGKELDSPVPEVIPWAYDPQDQPHLKRDVEKAKQELGAKTGIKFSLQISNASPELQQVAELVKDEVKDVGMEMDIQLIEFATIIQNGTSGDYQALCLGWSGAVDPDGDLYSVLYTKAGFNYSKYSSPQFDKALDDGRTNLDQAKRAEVYKQAQKILADDQPMIVLYNTPQISVARKEVQNYPQTYNAYWGARDFDQVWKTK